MVGRMNFTPHADLFIDVDKWGGQACLLQGKSSASRSQAVQFVQDDIFELRLYFCKTGGTGQAASILDLQTDTVLLAGKLAESDTTCDILASGFAAATDDDEDKYYKALIDLSGDELAQSLAAETSVTLKIEVKVSLPGATATISFRFDVKVNKVVYRGDEGLPNPQSAATQLVMIGMVNGTRYVITIDDTDPNVPQFEFGILTTLARTAATQITMEGSVNASRQLITVDDTTPAAPKLAITKVQQ